MATLVICGLLTVGSVLFLVVVFRLAWCGALVLWRSFLRIVEVVVRRVAGRDVS